MGALDPVKTIGHQLVETLRQHDRDLSRRAARQAAIELLRDVEVPSPERRLDDYPHQYSGGMRQRVMIAIASPTIPRSADRRRAHHRARRDDAGADPEAARPAGRPSAAPPSSSSPTTSASWPSFCDTVRVMYAGRIVESADDAPAVPGARASLRRRPAALGAAARSARARPAARDRGHAAEPRGAAPGVLVRAALPRSGRAASAAGSNRPSCGPSPRAAGSPSATMPRSSSRAERRRLTGERPAGRRGAREGVQRPARRRRRLLHGPPRRDVRDRRRVRLRQVDALARDPAARGADSRPRRSSTGSTYAHSGPPSCAACARGCRSSSRTRSARWTRA